MASKGGDGGDRLLREGVVEVAQNRADLVRRVVGESGVCVEVGDGLVEGRDLAGGGRGEEAARGDAEPGAEAGEGGEVGLSAGFDPGEGAEADARFGGGLPEGEGTAVLLEEASEFGDVELFDGIWSGRLGVREGELAPVGAHTGSVARSNTAIPLDCITSR